MELLGVYQEQGSVLVFVEKQESADDLLKDLMKAGYDCISLHGGIDQYDRDSAVVDFKNGKIKLMVIEVGNQNEISSDVHSLYTFD